MNESRKGGKKMKSTVFRLDPETHKALRIAAIEEGISMNEALTQAVETWLNEYRRRRGVTK
jgi:predicted HicB family RNase H-like nuclease